MSRKHQKGRHDDRHGRRDPIGPVLVDEPRFDALLHQHGIAERQEKEKRSSQDGDEQALLDGQRSLPCDRIVAT